MSGPPVETDCAQTDSTARLLRWNLDALSGRPAHLLPPADIRGLIDSSKDLPPLPEIARKLLALRNDPNASAIMLAGIVQMDPLLSAQMLRWANSAYYAVRTPVNTVQDAIIRALGYDLSLNLALGLTALSPLQTPNTGHIARDKVWQHGLACGRLMERLASHLPSAQRPAPGSTQFAALTQNIGYLLLGHLLPDHFLFLGRLIGANPTLALPAVERFALGVDHAQLGCWLFDAWEMPSMYRIVVRQHHNCAYAGEHQDLVLLTALADQLLSGTGSGLGGHPSEVDLLKVRERLGIEADACDQAVSNALAGDEETT